MQFRSPEEELKFLRALLRVNQIADVILEDCLEKRLGLSAAVDVYLTQTARMVHAPTGFVQVRGNHGPVLTRVLGNPRLDVSQAAQWEGAVPLNDGRCAYVARLTLGSLHLGSFGLIAESTKGAADHEPMLTLVRAIAEQLDTAVLSFMALADGRSPLERLDELNEQAAFRPRGRIGRYELVTPLGTGGMAQVMVARAVGPEGLGRLVALKRILPHLTAEKEMVQQFLDEARIGLRLSHPNVVTFYDFGQHGGAYFIAMELVKGVDFDQFIRHADVELPPRLAVAVMAQALAGLHAAHEARDEQGNLLGLVHRDLSPHNLMVGFDGVVKILDFGVAKARMQRTVTLPGIVKGKPVYMSPEQAVGDPLDRRSDLFAMATILYEALTGRVPFDREDDTKSMEAIVSDPVPYDHRIPGPVWDVLARAFEKNPEHRFGNAHEFRQALVDAQEPATDLELGRLTTRAFPDRLQEYVTWDRTGAHPTVAKQDAEVAHLPTRSVKPVAK